MPGDSSAFYRTRRWEKTRQRVLRRDEYLCRNCAQYGRRVQATVVHHIKERDECPELAYSADNLVSLCSACHNKMHPEKAFYSRRS